jgi:hypothetical protein
MVSRRVTPAVLALAMTGLPGCRQLFGIEDTEVIGADGGPTDGASTDTDGPPGPDATIDDAAPPDAQPVACPFSYLYTYGGHRYRYMGFTDDWLAARDACAADVAGAHLAIPDDIAENTQLSQWITQRSWIGIGDLVVEGNLITVLGQPPAFINWENGNSQNSGSSDCATMRDASGTNPGTWRVESCGVNRPYLCECPGP